MRLEKDYKDTASAWRVPTRSQAQPSLQAKRVRISGSPRPFVMVRMQHAPATMSRVVCVPQGEELSEEATTDLTTDVDTEDDVDLPSRLASQNQQEEPASPAGHLSKYELLARRKRRTVAAKKRRAASQHGVSTGSAGYPWYRWYPGLSTLGFSFPPGSFGLFWL